MKIRLHNKKKPRPILKYLLIPMSILIILEIVILSSSIIFSGVISQLNQNEKNILNEKIENRKNYLQNEMLNSWSNLEMTAENINKKTSRLIQEGQIDLARLDSSSKDSYPLLSSISSDIITMMRNNRVSGGFVVLSTQNLEEGQPKNKPGIYLRDMDPTANASVTNDDLLLLRGSSQVIKQLHISTASSWTPNFQYKQTGYDSMPSFYYPYKNALNSGSVPDQDLRDQGYWSSAYRLEGENTQQIAYSIPLRLPDGTVYGVLGIDITDNYLETLLPYNEITSAKQGTYILGKKASDSNTLKSVMISGLVYKQDANDAEKTTLHKSDVGDDAYYIDSDSKKAEYYAVAKPLILYKSNTAFSQDQWFLVGTLKEDTLLAFSSKVTTILIFCILMTLIAGAGGSYIISYIIARPIKSLSRDIEDSDPRKVIQLKPTNIREIDQLSGSIMQLNSNVIEANSKFTQILEMASTRIAGFEINEDTDSFFVTDYFFAMFQRPDLDTNDLTIHTFVDCLIDIHKTFESEIHKNDRVIYVVPSDTKTTYIQLKYNSCNSRHIGLLEDVTAAIEEKKTIEYERDHDLLTGLINRRAFKRTLTILFRDPKQLCTAAMIMFDLDNLKQINDTYGHDAGDKYIQQAAKCFVSASPENTIISRVSGDEFYLFLFGYQSREDILQYLDQMKSYIDKSSFPLASYKNHPIRVTGGIAWYPDDSSSLDELLRYSDFAMYQAKKTEKGQFSTFNMEVYHRESHLLQSKQELRRMLKEQSAIYHFQPIIDATTGEIFAYEALMRSISPNLSSPSFILAMAKEEGLLAEIEQLTIISSIEHFVSHVEREQISSTCRLFLNSLPNQVLPHEKVMEVEKKFKQYLSLLVIEITEEEKLDQIVQRSKMHYINSWGAGIALDDYGSGYNSEQSLLKIQPDYIKVDIDIIRNIDHDYNKQDIVAHVVEYGHERGMKIIAEGVETAAEAEKVIQLRVDFLQGYYLAKPALIPPKPEDNVISHILSLNK